MNIKPTNNPLYRYQVFFVALAVFCVLAVVVNLVVRRAPVHDATAESDLSSISSAINTYASNQGSLPDELSQLTGLSAATKKRLSSYDYVPSDSTDYQLCATFLSASPATSNGPNVPVPSTGTDTSNHTKGRNCFSYSIPGAYPIMHPLLQPMTTPAN